MALDGHRRPSSILAQRAKTRKSLWDQVLDLEITNNSIHYLHPIKLMYDIKYLFLYNTIECNTKSMRHLHAP